MTRQVDCGGDPESPLKLMALLWPHQKLVSLCVDESIALPQSQTEELTGLPMAEA